MSVVTLTEVKTHLNYPDPTDTTDDAELQGFIDAAVEIAESYVGPLTPTAVTDTFYDTSSSGWLMLRRYPVVSVETVTVTPDGGSSTGYTGSSLTADLDVGRVRIVNGYMSGTVTVDYTAGRSAVPKAVRLGVLDLIAHWWQRGQEGSAPGGGAIGQNAYDQIDTTAGSAYRGVPLDVIEKWHPYMLGQVVG
jgi:uncharacterized phiE125 gp8 family phage protein